MQNTRSHERAELNLPIIIVNTCRFHPNMCALSHEMSEIVTAPGFSSVSGAFRKAIQVAQVSSINPIRMVVSQCDNAHHTVPPLTMNVMGMGSWSDGFVYRLERTIAHSCLYWANLPRASPDRHGMNFLDK
jgi:hypothetical protein